MSHENVELARSILDTFCRESWESRQWIDRYHPDLVYYPREDEPDTRPCIGRGAWERIVSGFMDAFAEITFDVQETVDAGDWAIVSTVLHGRGGGSGIEVEDRYVFAYKMREGLVVEGREYHTTDQALAALRGEIPAGSEPA
jgi:ketosteroid isomerase-like protein